MPPGEGRLLDTEARNQSVEGYTDDVLVIEPYAIEHIPEPDVTAAPTVRARAREGASPGTADFDRRYGGAFGRVRWPGLVLLLVAIVVSVPFIATVLYTGPMGKSLNGTDVSYGASAIVAGIIYWLWAGHARAGAPERSVALTPVARQSADV